MRTSGPAIWPWSSTTPRASSALWDTTTMPTNGDSPRCEALQFSAPYRTEVNSTMPNDTRPERRRRATIQSVDRAALILKVLASGPRRLGVSEIAARLGLARPTVHGLLQTLQSHGLLEK